MSAFSRGVASAALVAALSLACSRSAGPEAPRLVVLLVVDQLRTEYLERFADHHVGGFKRLLKNGAYFPRAAYRHSCTSTGPGHATVSTGMHPATHGIVGNSWRERSAGSVYCVADDLYETVGGPGGGRSPMRLQADTLGDRLKARHPEAKVYSFSTKDRSAVLMAGRKADAAIWYESGCGCLVTSTYYADRLPEWLDDLKATGPAAAYSGRVWDRLLTDITLYERMARGDSFPGERDGTSSVLPRHLPDQDFESELRATPFSDEITLAAALAALQASGVGVDAVPDLLLLGLSATDSIGHRYGPFSQEAMDNHLRLDRELGTFLAAVDRLVGTGRAVIGLTADHGAVPLVEQQRAQGDSTARRLDTREFWERAETAIAECGGGPASDVIASAGGRNLYWNELALRERGIARGEASSCAQGWLQQQAGVSSVIRAEDLPGAPSGTLEALYRNAYLEGRSPHVQVHFHANVYPGGATGTGHGSAHAYDRQVPVLLAGPGISPGRYDSDAGPEDIAPTLAVLLGLEPALDTDSRVLTEALAPGL